MIDLGNIVGFVWDAGNIDKNLQKHGITPNEAEAIFLDENVLLQEDVKHSQKEERFIAIGKIRGEKILLAVFTVRDEQIRIISARGANQKERRRYEKT